jgi:adenylate cyclase
LSHNGAHACEYRFRRKDDSYCWVNDEQRLTRDINDKPLEIVGSWSDITARKAAEQKAAAADARLRQLLASSPEPLAAALLGSSPISPN